jgi:hypothetical protein
VKDEKSVSNPSKLTDVNLTPVCNSSQLNCTGVHTPSSPLPPQLVLKTVRVETPPKN